LILLGTGGGPRPRKTSSASAQVILINDAAYVIDCGDGVARQLVFANVPLPTVRHIFLTHQHSDHTADYGNLIWLAWTAGLRTRVDAWGPPPLEKMTELFFEMNASDITIRIADEGRGPLVPLVHVHELTRGGVVMQDENVKVTAALVRHPPVVPAFGYRFDTSDRIFKPRGEWHTFWNAGETPARILEIISPGGFEQAFREMHALGDALDADAMAAIAARYGVDVDFERTGPIIERHRLTF
jgi:ribonuclease BN (tRNA processing enzyme)